MKTSATITGANGPVKLTFGVFALKEFCKSVSCNPDLMSVLGVIANNRLEAFCQMVRAGHYEAHQEPISDFEACELIETGTEEEGAQVMKKFMSSILGEDYDSWFNRLQPEEKQKEDLPIDQSASEPAPAPTAGA